MAAAEEEGVGGGGGGRGVGGSGGRACARGRCVRDGSLEGSGERVVVAGEGLADPRRLEAVHPRVEHRAVVRHLRGAEGRQSSGVASSVAGGLLMSASTGPRVLQSRSDKPGSAAGF